MGEQADARAFLLAADLRKGGARVEIDHIGRSVKAQLKYADKIGARYVLVLGENELAANECKLKRMADGAEQTAALTNEAILPLLA